MLKNTQPYRRPRARALALTTALLCAAAITYGINPGAANAAATANLADNRLAALKLSPRLNHISGAIAAFVQTTGPGALAVDAGAKRGVMRATPPSRQAQARVNAIDSTTEQITAQATRSDKNARVLYRSRYTVPGVAMLATSSTYAALAARSDVVSITPLVAKQIPVAPQTGDTASPMTAGSDIYTQALKEWQQTGHTGTGIHMAIIDTGIDYTHADLGGPASTAVHAAAYASVAAPNPSWYDPKKFLGGWDFAGHTYNADTSAGPDYDPYPQPDANPIDGPGGGHGSHVAGIAGGYGENADGTTFRGDYRNLTATNLLHMKIGPGSAPGVGIYSLKVFGDFGGSTNLTGAALDWIGQQLTQGVDINVVNLSLGSDYSASDDPDNAKINALTAQGVLPVISAGNSGDVTDVGGSPGNSPAALTVAASSSGYTLYDEVKAAAPAELTSQGPYLAQYSQDYIDPLDLTAAVVAPQQTSNATGCAAFSTEDKARIQGKIVSLYWDESRLPCGSAVRFDNVAAAGGVGVLLADTTDTFESGIAGDDTIPGAEITATAARTIAPALAAGTLRVTFSDTLRQTQQVYDPTQSDTLASFTSRGGHGSLNGSVKPDLASPGVGIVSIGSGTNNGRTVLSGTSMASPHAAGIAALAFDAHPGWTPMQVKADLMNTAIHDTTLNGLVAPLERQGTGRIDALGAVDNQVTVTSEQNGPQVTASFGVLEVARALTQTRTLLLTNSGNSSQTYAVAAVTKQPLPGVGISASPARVTVAARGTATVTVTLSIPNPAALRRLRQATESPTLTDSDGTKYIRDYVPTTSGLITFTPDTAGVPALRVATFAAPKPVAAMTAAITPFASAKSTASPLKLTGHPLNQGDAATGYHSLLAPFVLGTTDPRDSFTGPASRTLSGLDIRAVGASSTAPFYTDPTKGTLGFGIALGNTSAELGTISNASIDIDVNGDGRPDFNTALVRSSTTDTAYAVTTDLGTGKTIAVSPAYGVSNGTNANIFDTASVVLTVPLAALGYDRHTASGKLRYRAITQSIYAPRFAATGDPTVDATTWVSFDSYRPTYTFQTIGAAKIVTADQDGSIILRRPAPSTARVLLLHLHNAAYAQAQILTAPQATPRPVRTRQPAV